MKARVFEIDDGLAVALPREAAVMLEAKPGEELFVTRLPDGGFRIGHNDPAHEKAMRIARKAMEDYAEAFKALAKS
jgi:hypothetical protein